MRPALYCRLISNALRRISSARSIPHHHRIPISPVPVRRPDTLDALCLIFRHRNVPHLLPSRPALAPVFGPRLYPPFCDKPKALATVFADPAHLGQHAPELVGVTYGVPGNFRREDDRYGVAVNLHIAGCRVDAATL